MPKENQHQHPSTVPPLEGIANSPSKFYFELLFLFVFADVFLALWLWKIKSFPSHPWYQSIPEFSKDVAGLVAAIGAGLPVVVTSAVFIWRAWTGSPPIKSKDAVKTTFALLKKFVNNRLAFRTFALASILASVIISVVIVSMPGSKQVTVFFKAFPTDPNQPVGLVISPDNKQLYVADEEASRLVVLTTSSLKIRHTIPVPDKPHRLAITPDGKTIFVTSAVSGVVDVIDSSTYKILARIPTGSKPYWIAITPNGKKVYVSNQGDLLEDYSFTGSISVIDATNYTVINTITNLNFPEGMDIARDTGLLYLASQGGRTHEISEVNLSEEQVKDKFAEIQQHTVTYGNWGGDPVFVIDTATDQVLRDQTISNMEVGVTLAVKPDGTKVYVARGNFRWRGPFRWRDFSHKDRTPLGVIDTTAIGSPKILTNIILKTSVSAVAMTPDGRYALIGSGNEITIIDTNTDRVANRVKIPSGANDIVAGADDWVYVTIPEKGLLFAFSLKGLV